MTRNGQQVGELIPLRRSRRFVSRVDFAQLSRTAPTIDLERFRTDQETTEQVLDDPYDR